MNAPSDPRERAPERTIYCEDALEWLPARAPLTGCSLVTSLPDVSAFPGISLPDWRKWFVDAARWAVRATPDDGVSIFYQTDIKVDGAWVDKGALCQGAAELEGAQLLWHKIACRKPVGRAAYGRPAYSHILCYSRGVRDRPAPYPDVLPAPEDKLLWSQAMSLEACRLCCRYVLSHTETRTIVDPFCGWGTVLAVANQLGLDAVGVEISHKRARKARNLRL